MLQKAATSQLGGESEYIWVDSTIHHESHSRENGNDSLSSFRMDTR